jgi:sugar/nucleoside kinase (ribokinase family)
MASDRKPGNTLKRLDVLVASDMCVDLMLYGKERPRFGQFEQTMDGCVLELGGSANIFATQIAKLGAGAGVIGYVGDDSFGRFLRRRLARAGVDTSGVRTMRGLATGVGVTLLVGDDRAILTYPGSIDATGPEDLPDDPGRACRHWHIASYFLMKRLRAHWRDWLLRCRRAGVTTSLDPNWDPDNRWEGVGDLLPLLDLLFVNEAEAHALAGTTETRSAALRLAANCAMAVVKLGSRGSMAVRNGQVWELGRDSCEEPCPVVDSVGAGDNFDAGFLHAWMQGLEVQECLALGHRCAVSSLRRAGGIEGQLRRRKRKRHVTTA